MPSSVKKHHDLERAYKFLLGMNFLFAILIISWIPRLSEVKKLLGLNNEVFGSLLGLGSIGSLVAYGSSGYVIERFGSKRVINVSIIMMAISYGGITWTRSVTIFALINLFAAAGGSFLHIALSGLQTVIQKELGRPIIPKMHGSFNVGFLIVILIGGVISPFISVRTHLTVISIIISPIFFYCATQLPSSRDFEMGEKPHFGLKFVKELIPRTQLEWLVSLGLICATVIEISTNDWMAIYARETLNIPAGPHVIYFILFSLAMIIARWKFASMLKRFGSVNLIHYGSIIGSIGYAIGIYGAFLMVGSSPAIAFVLAGFGVLIGGFGIGGIQAIFIKVLGDKSGASLNVALGRVYFVFTMYLFVIRLIISFIAERVSVAAALLVPAVLLLLTFRFAHLADEDEDLLK